MPPAKQAAQGHPVVPRRVAEVAHTRGSSGKDPTQVGRHTRSELSLCEDHVQGNVCVCVVVVVVLAEGDVGTQKGPPSSRCSLCSKS